MKILIVTACGARKGSKPMSAYKLYKSTRIKAVYNRRCGYDMCILSAKYGLVNAHELIEPYEQVMDEQRAEELVLPVAEKLKSYDYIVFFKGGARKAYLSCVKAACDKAGKNLVTLGYANLGGVNDMPQLLRFIKQEDWVGIHKIRHANICWFSNKSGTA